MKIEHYEDPNYMSFGDLSVGELFYWNRSVPGYPDDRYTCYKINHTDVDNTVVFNPYDSITDRLQSLDGNERVYKLDATLTIHNGDVYGN